MKQRETKRIRTISEFHSLRGLPKPWHPLISVIDYKDIVRPDNISEVNWTLDFYQVSVKKGLNAKLGYGQQQYDFDEGVMFFISPNQVFRIEPEPAATAQPSERSGWMLLIHPDFLWKSSLGSIIRNYDFFDYSVNEALFLSDKEENVVNFIIESIRQEHHANIDKFSQNIILAHLETLLNYAERFYERQFITRKISNHQIVSRLEDLLHGYFSQNEIKHKPLPTVEFIAGQLHLSPNYLSRVLKTLTGQSTQQFIQDKIIDQAKGLLSTSDLSVSEIGYRLGFEHPQSFTRFFKKKTQVSPVEFRQTFN